MDCIPSAIKKKSLITSIKYSSVNIHKSMFLAIIAVILYMKYIFCSYMAINLSETR